MQNLSLKIPIIAYHTSYNSYDSNKYERTWIKAKIFCVCTLSTGECSDACSRALLVAHDHKEIARIMVGDQR